MVTQSSDTKDYLSTAPSAGQRVDSSTAAPIRRTDEIGTWKKMKARLATTILQIGCDVTTRKEHVQEKKKRYRVRKGERRYAKSDLSKNV